MRIEPKVRTSIVEGSSVFLSLFDDNPRVRHVFCPPKAVYEAREQATSGTPPVTGVALPPMAELLQQGKVVVLNFPSR